MSATEAKGKGEGDGKAPGKDAAEGGGGGGGLKAWLPLVVTIVLMPVLAFVTTNFLVLPKIVHARGGGDGAEEPFEGGEEHGGGRAESAKKEAKKDAGGHGEKKDEGKKDARGHGAGKKKQNYPVAKVIVNVSGSMGSRYLMTSFTLVGTHNDFKEVLEENKDQLLDLASTTLAAKTISDLEKPGARNQIRAELISIFNNALGGSYVQEIFFTEFAIQ